MNKSQFYALHSAYGGLREATHLAAVTEQGLPSQHGVVESPAAGPPSLRAVNDAVGTAGPQGASMSMMMSSTDALPVKSEAHMFHRRMPDDSAFLVTPDAELCARHHASLAQVWAWRTQLSQQQSPLYHRTSTIAAPSASGHREPQDTTETTLEGGTPHSPHRPCTAANLLRSCCRATPPHLLTGSGSDAHGRVSAAASAAAAVVAASSSHLFLPTGLRSLDAALLGGLRRGWVTELTGLPGTGKTTLAAEWCRSCLRHARSCGTAHDCVWLQSGSAVHSAVLATAHEEADATELSSLVDAVHVACLSSLDGLQQLLARWQGTEGSASPLSTVGLIVLDSITDLMRRSFRCEDDDALQRHEALATTLQSLKRLAEEQRVAVLVITQQQRHPWPALGRSSISHTIRGVDFSSEDVGQLGRLFFHNGDREALRLRWQLEVLKSPLCAPFAVGLQLRVPTSLSCSDDPPCVPGLPLCVEEVDDDDGSRGSAVPLAPNTQVEEGLSLLSLDPWDYTEVPSFLYL
ncbi:Rad51 family protein [Leishmania donovani]|uniref:Rad51 family protein n=1 Tax=Leishmania donovani TaxID=5661 RepID=A0A504XYU4_LEIDO|nr:Rad51 family protein [Leishmania donovani]